LQAWTASESFENFTGDVINYKYFVVWDPSRLDPASPNYIPNLIAGNGWEEPGITGGGNRTFVWQNASQQNASPGVDTWDGIPSLGVITSPISVTFNVDMRPATDAAVNPNTSKLFRRGTDSVWIRIDTPLFAVSQGFTARPRDYRLQDPDNDGIYSGTFALRTPVWYSIGYKVAYSQDPSGTIIDQASSFARGRRYYQFIRPASISATGPTWPAAYSFPTVAWKYDNLPVEDPPALITAVEEKPTNGVPLSFALERNYPNPFNPETTIKYQVARTSEVKIGIYNVMGQLVKTLVNETKNAGNYTIVWNGDNAQGKPAPTGVYFLKMEAGDFIKVHKMALVK
ncbi:MAG: FlgD immunoglobulin-like domain containing protein, partial [bacterium]